MDKQKAEEFRNIASSRLGLLIRIKHQIKQPIIVQLLTPPRPDNPSVIFGGNSTQRHLLTVNVSTFEPQHTRKIFYRFNKNTEFKSTGTLANNPLMANPVIEIEDRDEIIELFIKYTDSKGHTNGPHKILLDIRQAKIDSTKNTLNIIKNSWVMFRDYDQRLLIYFTSIVTYAKGIEEIRYSIDNKILDQRFEFDEQKPYDHIYIEPPYKTKSIFVQLQFKDQSLSDVMEYKKPLNLRKE